MEAKRIIVCGGGVIGASIVYHLTQKGVQPTLIERNHVACAASGKAGGFLALDWCDNSAVGPLARRSFALHLKLSNKLPDYGYRAVDTLSIESNLSKSKLNSKYSALPLWLDGNVAASKVLGNTSSTAQVHPEKFTQALVNESQKGPKL